MLLGRIGIGLALLLPCLTLPSRALACVVGTGTDTSCTESALNDCLPGGGSFDGTVTFNCGGAATITVASTKTISADTTIDGGSLITISGGNSVGVFSVNIGIKFTVQNLTITNGNSAVFGGGIYSGGALTVTNSTFSSNSTGAGNGGGGAIFNEFGTLTVTNSTFSGNSAGYGGGVFNDFGTLAVTNSTFSGNSASAGSGGGIYNNGGTLTVTNSTLSGNSASAGSSLGGNGGGIYNNGGTLTVTNSTLSGNSAVYNGGGIFNDFGTLTVTNTIVANTTAGGNCAGAVTDGGHNIDDGATCGFTGTGCTATTGTSFCNTNPVFDPTGLQNNGGPTQTIALCTGPGAPSAACTGASPAINAGDEGVCSTTTGTAPVDNLDQRGFVRPGTGAANCSIGAFEANSAAPTCVVGTGTDTSCTESALDACLPGGGSFDGTVTFNCGGAATITVTSTKTISADTTIDGGSLITISGGNSVGVFSVHTGVNFTVQNLIIANGNSASFGFGGGIFNSDGTLTVINSTFSGNSTTVDGGGIFNNSGGALTVTNSTFSGNSTRANGGGIFNNSGGTLTVTNSTFSGNSTLANGSGGGIYNDSGTLTVINSTFSGNSVHANGSVGGSGGGIGNSGGTLTVSNSTFSSNSAVYDGGGISNYFGVLAVTNSTFSSNSAHDGGGGIYSWGTLTVTNNTVSNNSGGGIFSDGGAVTVTNSTVSGNSGGGGIDSHGTLTITNSTVSSNSAYAGGGIFSSGTLTVTNSTVSDNSAAHGGGIYNDSGTVTVTNTIVVNSTLGGNCYGAVTDGGHNIDDGRTCGFRGTGCTATTGTSFCNTNPVLDPTGLQDNGGPTRTIALCTGTDAPSAGCTGASPAIDAGDESVCSTTTGTAPVDNLDQRGFVRPGTGAANCSIGAYEYNSPGPPPPCEGDCNGDRRVTVDEILTMVNIALGNTPLLNCEAADANHDGNVTVDEILTAVNNALDGCPGQVTPTPVYSISGVIRYYGNGVAVPGVVVELKGATTLSAQTDANGLFTFAAVSAGSWQVQPAKMGGAGGAINMIDAVRMLQFSNGSDTPNPGQQLACDVSGDGTITEDDATLIQEYAIDLLTRFPVADACGSDWIFVPVPSAAVNQSVTQPLISGGTCQPGSITFDPISAAAANQDFEAILIGDCNLSWPSEASPAPAAGG